MSPFDQSLDRRSPAWRSRPRWSHLAILTDLRGQVEERLEALLANDGA